jgi:hypothetical protein
VSARQIKRARAYAYKEAERQGLWKKGEADVYAKWYRRLAARIFPRFRKRYMDAIGRWYKATLKRWSKEAYASIHDRDAQAFARTQRKLARKRQLARSVKILNKAEV